MSTKRHISSGDDWHLYEELNDGSVELHLKDIYFRASNTMVTVELPEYVIEAIVKAHREGMFPYQEQEQDKDV